MFTNLLESRARTPRSVGGSFVSLTMHAALIVLAIQATLHAGQRTDNRETKLDYAEVKKDEPAPPKELQDVHVAAPPKGFQVLTVPLNIPDVLPAIDLSRPPTSENDWVAKGAPGGRENGIVGAPPVGNVVYIESQVEKPVMAVPGSPAPRYPDVLKAAGVEGEAAVSFVVDTTGRAEPSSIQILNATNDLFGAAVRTALPNMRFLPAEIGGKKVRQKVLQPFVFTIVR
jgi:protein TonB